MHFPASSSFLVPGLSSRPDWSWLQPRHPGDQLGGGAGHHNHFLLQLLQSLGLLESVHDHLPPWRQAVHPAGPAQHRVDPIVERRLVATGDQPHPCLGRDHLANLVMDGGGDGCSNNLANLVLNPQLSSYHFLVARPWSFPIMCRPERFLSLWHHSISSS